MKILITGIAGFIGSHCAKYLGNKHDLIGVDLFKNKKNLCRIKGLNDIQMITADISDRSQVAALMQGVDVVINFAANTFVDQSIKHPEAFVKSNILGTFNLLEEARIYPLKKFIHISTDEVYGSIDHGYSTEEAILNPGNPYSATKAAADQLCISYRKTYNIPVVILRPENNYGTFQSPQNMIPTFIKKALKGEPLSIYGDGKQCRMWLHVEDFCAAIEMIIETIPVCGLYNIGGKDEHENISVAKQICDILDKPFSGVHIPDESIRPGHDRRYGIEIERIVRLGWRPKHRFVDSLPEVVKWYAENQWWLK